MTPDTASIPSPHISLEQQAAICFTAGDYAQASTLYEQLIAEAPTNIPYYWHLGLALVLQGKEAEAQMTWMSPILEASEDRQEQKTAELTAILRQEADRQEALAAYESAWLLRQHLQEFTPADDENLLHIIRLALAAETFNFEDGLLTEMTDRLNSISSLSQPQVLLQISQRLLQYNPGHDATLNFLEACIPHWVESQVTELVQQLLATAEAIFHHAPKEIASRLDHLSLRLAPDSPKALFNVLYRLQLGNSADRLESIAVAERCLALSTTWMERINATDSLLSSWLYNGGNWQRATEIYRDYKALLIGLPQAYADSHHAKADENLEAQDLGFLTSLLPMGTLFFYFEDSPQSNRPLRNQVAQIGQMHLQSTLSEEVQRYQSRNSARIVLPDRKLPRIGYFAGSLRQHSVGWLARWLLKYHDRNRFDIHLYCSRPSNDPIQNQFRQDYGDRFHDVSSSIADIADCIYDDQIDILVELDSLTSFGGCGVVALKPAPIQVHWLGYDASGIPEVDYFVVDPYVVPEDAQSYYSETLWRLPHTYIAVDGFETHTPSLRRDQLGIPADAIVYLSSQTGLKRNIDYARLQMQVIKEVPGSYFLIKSFLANIEYVEAFFRELAESEGVSADRLRFLPDVSSEFVHRANLAIADVVLDTYPYNGATTTLEALWTGLPIVTRVGEQFAARNSYTMMMNAGITEGISWSDEEYLEWGIRLGTDVALRQDIFYRLKRSHHTSPLWNGKQFARDMESAYAQMWERL